MSGERFLVTGGLGCLGAWVCRLLVADGAAVTIFDAGADDRRLRLVLDPGQLSDVELIRGDLTDAAQVSAAVGAATHVIHLAALQVPFCRADPARGAAVNVTGTIHVLEAVKAHDVRHLVYASSAAVYGPPESYDTEVLPADAARLPSTLYGIYKVANEDAARVYWLDHEVSSIGLRPHTVYGPGRDQGMTSQPTTAILSAVRGRSYHIDYGGTLLFQHAADVAATFVRAARAELLGAAVHNLGGEVGEISELVEAIVAATDFDGLTHGSEPLALPKDFDDTALRTALGSPPVMSLADGVAATVESFRRAVAEGRPLPDLD
ncbi:MAG: NAD(P)-dependent oxidoreductase [Acidimicrobiia bacterium]|nr:NAD(P)-dependent oxidoreductase [Acidimicrobiia bacterium]